MEEEGNGCGGGTEHKSYGVESPYRQRKRSYRTGFKLLLLLGVLSLMIYYAKYSSSMAWWESFPLHVPYRRLINLTDSKNPQGTFRADTHAINRTNSPNVSGTHNAETNAWTEAPLTTLAATKAPLTTGSDSRTTTVRQFQYHLAYAPNYRFILDDTTACKTETPFLVLMVPVAPSEVAARNAIRKTWGSESPVHGVMVRTVFVLGLPGGANAAQQQDQVRQENLLYHDLIQSDFMDTYLNLTLKTMVIMDWLATRCPKAEYAMKVDSDMFLNIGNLVSMLQTPGLPKRDYLTGYMMWNRPVVRDRNSKWYVPKEMYPDDTYPTYTLGMGYLFSNDLPAKYVEISKEIKPFNIEDAYIGMCMKKLGLSPTSPPNPWQWKAYNQGYNRCEYSKIITYILSSPQQLLDYWTDLKKPEPPC